MTGSPGMAPRPARQRLARHAVGRRRLEWRDPQARWAAGSNGGEAMVVLAVVLAAIAVVMAIGLVSSEGVRFDGIGADVALAAASTSSNAAATSW